VFKKYPSCALTASSTNLILQLATEEKLAAEDIEHVFIAVGSYAYKLVGHLFAIGDNPTVNAQFSIQYCVANALLRKSSKLAHFEEHQVRDPIIAALVGRIHVVPDESVEARGHTAVDMRIVTRCGKQYARRLDIAPGYPGNRLSADDHEHRFWDCIEFAATQRIMQTAPDIVALMDGLENAADVRSLVSLLT
jgi:2-methylcitrate dehydratase PrpD